ncbi:MAG: 3-deoxy-8-phosphooctulonate synthase, partial [Flavobacteriaceae bacterium]|nr:3-deoxy-8-phosphooctulonate synthase [Flavobacteriaceae bacterium]
MDLTLIPKLKHLESGNFFLLAGPCAIEGDEMAMRIAEKIVDLTDKLKIPYVFKGSFKKANRSRIDSFTGIGNEKALKILRRVNEQFEVPIVTDIHEVSDAAIAANYVDILQIPAFLVRQTDLVVAAAKTGKVVNLKKGQFMSAESMQYAVKKVTDSGNEKVLITDRGTMFGYQDMIVDF